MANISKTLAAPLLTGSQIVTVAYDGLPNGDALNIEVGRVKGIPQIYRLTGFYAELVCSAEVGNRNIAIWKYKRSQGSSRKLWGFKTGNIAATETKDIHLSPVTYVSNVAHQMDFVFGYSGSIYLFDDDYLSIYIGSGLAGDLLSTTVELEYMNRRLGMPTPDMEVGA